MQAENSGLIGQLSIRVERLEETMAYLEAKEKDLRTIVIDGFARMDNEFRLFHTKIEFINEKLEAHDEQIDTLAIELKTSTDKMDKKLDILNGNMNKLMGNMGKIMHALAID